MLEERANIGRGRDAYIFGVGSNFMRPFSGWGKCTERLRAAMPDDGDRWTLHDIRRTVATRLYEAGGDSLAIEDLLGHIGGVRHGVAGTYNRAITLDKQRASLETWALKLRSARGF